MIPTLVKFKLSIIALYVLSVLSCPLLLFIASRLPEEPPMRVVSRNPGESAGAVYLPSMQDIVTDASLFIFVAGLTLSVALTFIYLAFRHNENKKLLATWVASTVIVTPLAGFVFLFVAQYMMFPWVSFMLDSYK